MILGIGTDIIDITRIEKSLKKKGFKKRVFTRAEREAADKKSKKVRVAYFAKRFAAKEAFAKALGTGIGKSIGLQDIEVLNNENGEPVIYLNSKGRALLRKLAGKKTPSTHVSLSDEPPYALAFVVISLK